MLMEAMELKAHKDKSETREARARKEFRVRLANADSKESLVQMEKTEVRAHKGHKGKLVMLEVKGCKVRLV